MRPKALLVVLTALLLQPPLGSLADEVPICYLSDRPITLQLKDTDIRKVFVFFEETAGRRIALDPCVEGKIDLDLAEVPMQTAFATVVDQMDFVCMETAKGYVIRCRKQLLEEGEGARLVRPTTLDLTANRVQDHGANEPLAEASPGVKCRDGYTFSFGPPISYTEMDKDGDVVTRYKKESGAVLIYCCALSGDQVRVKAWATLLENNQKTGSTTRTTKAIEKVLTPGAESESLVFLPSIEGGGVDIQIAVRDVWTGGP